MQDRKYIPEVDGLRAVAVLSVLLFHLDVTGFSGGFIGVDVFFVISGFLITRLIVDEYSATGGFSFSNFYVRRARRLFPALYVILLISLLCSFLLFTPQHMQRFGGELLYSLFSISNFYFWQESGYFNTASDFKPLLHTWSLSVEEQFYLLWPVFLYLLLGHRKKWMTLAAISLIGSLSLVMNFVLADGYSELISRVSPNVMSWFSDGSSTIFFLMPFRIFEFAIGASLVWLTGWRRKVSWLDELFMLFGLFMIGYSVTAYNSDMVFPSVNALIPCIGTALAIFSANAKYSGVLLRNGLIVWIGLISYSVYLIHWPVIVFFKYNRVAPPTVFDKTLLFSIALLFGYLMFRFVEKPFRHQYARGWSKAEFGLLCLSLSFLLVLPSATAWANGGWAWRSREAPPDVAMQIKDSKQFHIEQYGGAGFNAPYAWLGGSSSDPADIVVIGDSHAAQLKYGINMLVGRQSERNVYFATTTCLMLPGVTRKSADFDRMSCPETFDNAMSIIDGNPKAKMIIAESWDFQIPKAHYLESDVALMRDQDIRSGYLAVVDKLIELKSLIGDRELIVIGNVPGAAIDDLIGCYSRPIFSPVDCNALAWTARKDREELFIGNSILKEGLSQIDGLHYIDPFDIFCDESQCQSIRDGKILYSDKSHLSKEGSFVLAEYMNSSGFL